MSACRGSLALFFLLLPFLPPPFFFFSHPTASHTRRLRPRSNPPLAGCLSPAPVELAPPEIHTLRVATRHRGYTHTVFTFFADAVTDLIRPFIAEPAYAQTAPL